MEAKRMFQIWLQENKMNNIVFCIKREWDNKNPNLEYIRSLHFFITPYIKNNIRLWDNYLMEFANHYNGNKINYCNTYETNYDYKTDKVKFLDYVINLDKQNLIKLGMESLEFGVKYMDSYIITHIKEKWYRLKYLIRNNLHVTSKTNHELFDTLNVSFIRLKKYPNHIFILYSINENKIEYVITRKTHILNKIINPLHKTIVIKCNHLKYKSIDWRTGLFC